MELLWKRLEKQRGRQPASVAEAWESLRDLGQAGASEKRHQTLIQFLKDMSSGNDDNTWAEKLLETSDELVKKRTLRIQHEKLTKGQLESQHGKKEARMMIRTGKVKEVEAKDGMTKYIRVNETDTAEKSRAQALKLNRHVCQTHIGNTDMY